MSEENDNTKRRWFILSFEEEDAPPFYDEGDVRHRMELTEVEEVRFDKPGQVPGVLRFGSSQIHGYKRFPRGAAINLRGQDLERQVGRLFVKAESESKIAADPLACVPGSVLHEKQAKHRRLLEMLEKEIARIENDERLSYPPAKVEINAPLALVQVELKALRTAYLKVKEWLKTET